jgi:hypothetical protein
VAIIVAVGGILFATAFAIWRRPCLLKAALDADRRLGLQERLTSSLQLRVSSIRWSRRCIRMSARSPPGWITA